MRPPPPPHLCKHHTFGPDTPPFHSKFKPSSTTTTLPRIPQRKNPPLNTIHQQNPTPEIRIHTPTARKFHQTPLRIILRMHVEKPHLLKPFARGIGLDAPDIHNAEPAVVVALVGETVLDVLVVVDGFDGRLVDARVAWGGEGRDVEDVGGGATVGGEAGAVLFVEFVVEEEEGHVRAGGEPALVRVGGAGVGGAGDLAGGLLVGYVDDGELDG